MTGQFYGIGVGPGDPELLTVKATRILSQIDIVIVPESRKKVGSVALDIAQPYLKPEIEQLTLLFPMTRDWEALHAIHTQNAQIILGHLQQGKNIAFLTLGDPMLYSTYSYLLTELQNNGVEPVSIPGIYSFSSISNLLNLPLVQGDEKLAVICDFTPQAQNAIAEFNTVVCMKVSAYHQQLLEYLNANPQWQFQMVSQVGKSNQQIDTSPSALSEPPHYFTTAILKRKN